MTSEQRQTLGLIQADEEVISVDIMAYNGDMVVGIEHTPRGRDIYVVNKNGESI